LSGEDFGSHAKEFVWTTWVVALHCVRVIRWVSALLEHFVTLEIVPAIAQLLDIILTANLGIEEASVRVYVAYMARHIGLARWRRFWF
jgi:hypothetical protein